jgi:DNA polymerase III delta prime subunit
MNKLENALLVESYRPRELKDLICDSKSLIEDFLKYPLKMPSLLLYSSSPGTGKTTLAKIISSVLKCDTLTLNASKERGISTIREQVNTFAELMSSNPLVKRMVFLDEADGLTSQSLDSLRNLMEEYSNNTFFVLTANDVNKVIPAIRSRCVLINFEKPNKKEILSRLEYICNEEKIKYDIETLVKLMDLYYPDLRSMIKSLQNASLDERSVFLGDNLEFERFLKAIEEKDVNYIYNKTFDNTMNIMAFNGWFFKYLMKNYKKYDFEEVRKISSLLAETEKSWNMGANLPIIFIANALEISQILRKIHI